MALGGRTDKRTVEHQQNYMIIHWTLVYAKWIETWKWSLQFSGPKLPSMHYLAQFPKAIVVVVSISQPISLIICGM